MSNLPFAPAVVSYGDVIFPTETETLDCSVRPVMDAAGRVVKWLLHQITVRFLVGKDNQSFGRSTDVDLDAIRAELTQAGQELHFESVGYGFLAVNTPSAGSAVGSDTEARDVVYGPKPTVLRWKPMGQAACECVWSVEVALAPCPEDALYGEGMLEWCWRANWSIDRSGYTTRTLSGFVRVAGWRGEGQARTLTDQADRLRERINPPVPAGFRRESQQFTLDEQKTRLDYSFSDVEEPPNVPPAGAVEVQASHTLTTESLYAGINWKGNLSATYELSRDRPRHAAEGMFFALVKERVAGGRGVPFVAGGKPGKAAALYRGYECSEPEIYGRRCAAFRLEYTLIAPLRILLQASGLWKPVAGSNWALWSASLANSAFHVRGNAKMAFDLGDDALIDICEPEERPQMLRSAPPKPPGPGGRELISNDPPDLRSSWLYYYCTLYLEQIDETVELKPLPVGRLAPLPARNIGPGLTQAGGLGGPDRLLRTAIPSGDDLGALMRVGPAGAQISPVADAPAASSTAAPVVQRRAGSSWYAYLTGFAARAGFPVPPPSLVSVGGAKAVAANRGDRGEGFSQAILANWFGVPIILGKWRLRYLLAAKPDGEIPVMNNPLTGG